MEPIRFVRTYEASEQRRYVSIPFDMPASMERLDITYEYRRYRQDDTPTGKLRTEENIIDLGLYDPKGNLVGWSSHSLRRRRGTGGRLFPPAHGPLLSASTR